MIVVDSSIWIEFFHNTSNKKAYLDPVFQAGADIFTLDIIVAEVLSGFKKDRDFEKAKEVLCNVPRVEMGFDVYLNAVILYRTLRKKGVTIRGFIDCLIAQSCIEHKAELFSLDRDFKKISKHSKLKLLTLT